MCVHLGEISIVCALLEYRLCWVAVPWLSTLYQLHCHCMGCCIPSSELRQNTQVFCHLLLYVENGNYFSLLTSPGFQEGRWFAVSKTELCAVRHIPQSREL